MKLTSHCFFWKGSHGLRPADLARWGSQRHLPRSGHHSSTGCSGFLLLLRHLWGVDSAGRPERAHRHRPHDGRRRFSRYVLVALHLSYRFPQIQASGTRFLGIGFSWHCRGNTGEWIEWATCFLHPRLGWHLWAVAPINAPANSFQKYTYTFTSIYTHTHTHTHKYPVKSADSQCEWQYEAMVMETAVVWSREEVPLRSWARDR